MSYPFHRQPINARRRALGAHVAVLAALFLAACAGDDSATEQSSPTPTSPATPVASTEPVAVASPITAQAAVVGAAFRFDASKGGTAFTDPRKTGLTYTTSVSAPGLSATGCDIVGTPTTPGVHTVTIVARDTTGRTASQQFTLVVFAADLASPVLPSTLFAYSDASSPLPRHFANGITAALDNMPAAANATTDAGATLGRVLFHDRRLSVNDRVACASCHVQATGFADTARLSRGFAGGLTGRHSMALTNARWYQSGRFFWDERAASLEAQVLAPIQDATEMGLTLDQLVAKVGVTAYYGPLFTAAFGSSDVTSDRIARALAQFVRSLVSSGAKYDQAFTGAPGNGPNFAAVFTPQELAGQQLFTGRAGCARCHTADAQSGDGVHNTGLDATITDAGAGNGRFKSPSLRNVAVRGRFMHDGRFTSLAQVIDFYDAGVQNNPALDPRLRGGQGPNGPPQRLNLSATEKAALVAFLGTLTDSAFLTNPKFANPFPR